jgi:hypothetical protein
VRPSPPPDARFRARLALILLVALAARLALILVKGPVAHFADTAEYDLAARSILAGRGVDAGIPRAPLYPAFLALVYAVAGVGNFVAVRLAQLPLALAAVLLAAAIGMMGGSKPALLAAAATALSPTLVYTGTMLYPTALYTLIALAITALALRLERHPSLGGGAALGACFALGWLTDQVILAPILAVAVWLSLRVRARGRRLAGALAAAVALAVLVAVAVASRQGGAPGHQTFFLNKAEYVLYAARHDTVAVGGHALRDTSRAFAPLPARAFLARELGLLARRPLDYLHDVGFEFGHFFWPYPDRITTANRFTSEAARWLVALCFAPVVPLALVGLVAGSAPRHERVLVALLPVAAAASYALLFSQVRYRVPWEPHLLALAAMGWFRLRAGRTP